MTRSLASAVGILLTCMFAPAGLLARGLPVTRPEEVGLSSERLERIRASMEGYVDRGQLAGTITAVARHGKVAHFERVGMMDVEAGKEMRPDTIFRMYSMTKPVTGVAMMILYEEGRFLLTDPASKYLPELEGLRVYRGGLGKGVRTEPARPMTVRHLLTHTSGLTYGDAEPGVPDMYRGAKLWEATSLQDFMQRLVALPLVAQPGTEWHYSVSMDVLGRLVEVLSGEPFDQFLENRIFRPLGMVDTAFYVPEDKLERFAASYRVSSEGGIERVPASQGGGFQDPQAVPYGGSGLVSTAADFLRFAQMLVGDGELDGVRILGRKTVDLMMANHLGPELGPEPLASFTPWLQSSAQGVGMGLSGGIITDVGLSSVPGSVGSFFWGGAASTYFWVDREEQLVGLLLTQLSPSAAYPLRAEMRVLTYQALID